MGMAPVVLVVDDDPDILDALSEILGQEGMVVRRARNGVEALEVVGQQRPDLVLLDLMMPVMDGWEFARRVRERPDGWSIPIVVLSADRNVAANAAALNAVGQLAKPFELEELLELLHRFLPAGQEPTPPV